MKSLIRQIILIFVFILSSQLFAHSSEEEVFNACAFEDCDTSYCSLEGGTKDCNGLKIGSDCMTRGLLGAPLDGVCKLKNQGQKCGCFEKFN